MGLDSGICRTACRLPGQDIVGPQFDEAPTWITEPEDSGPTDSKLARVVKTLEADGTPKAMVALAVIRWMRGSKAEAVPPWLKDAFLS